MLTINKCHPQLLTYSSSRPGVRTSSGLALHRSVGRQGATTNLVVVGDTRGVNLNCGFLHPGKPGPSISSRPLIKQLNVDYDSLILAIIDLEIALNGS